MLRTAAVAATGAAKANLQPWSLQAATLMPLARRYRMEYVNVFAIHYALSMREQHLHLGCMVCSTAFAAQMHFQPLLSVHITCDHTCIK